MDRYIAFILSRSGTQVGQVEKHHICPKAKDLFPEYSDLFDNPWNEIRLSPREHFVAHLLLRRAYGGSQIYALWRMTNSSPSKLSSRMYENLKQEFCFSISQKMTGVPKPERSESHKLALSKPHRKRWSEEARQRSSEARKGIAQSSEHKKNSTLAKIGRKRSPETIEKMRLARIGRKHSPETIEKMKSRIPWNKGIRKAGA
jgi:hypothetical protein